MGQGVPSPLHVGGKNHRNKNYNGGEGVVSEGSGKCMFKMYVFMSVGPLYTSPPSRPVHSGTNSTSVGSIIAMQQLRAKTNH